MKLLPFFLPYIKDAARAVKRICQEEFIEVQDGTLTKLLGIATLLVTMYAMRKEGEQEVLHLWCKHKADVAICPRCGALSETIHDEQPRCVRHLDVWGKRTFLHFLSRRFDCEQCRRSFTEELAFVDTNRRQTRAFEQEIYKSCIGSNKKKVAKDKDLSQSSVRDIFNRCARQQQRATGSGELTRVLGIDEISLKKRHQQFALVISDIERRCLVAVLPGRDKESLEQWLDSLSDSQRKAIRFVSIDMWVPYRLAVSNKLAHATVVVDRFHVMKQLNMRLTQLRSNIQRNATPEVQATLKGSRWILVRNRCDLKENEQAQLNKILDLCPQLRTLYLLKEEFRAIFEKVHCRDKARKFLAAWVLKAQYTGNKFLKKFVTTVNNWREEILNYFIERITNGFVEGLNGALRNIIRTAFGYRNFVNFRLRLFAQYSFPTNPR